MIKPRRVWQGALVGGIVFFVWSVISAFGIEPALEGNARIAAAFQGGFFIMPGRLPVELCLVIWLASLCGIAYGLAWAYAGARARYGAAPPTAVKQGLLVGFADGFPLTFAHAVFPGARARVLDRVHD